MRRALFASLLFLVGTLCLAQAQMNLMGVGGGGKGTPLSGYTGPGDIVSGASAWYGLRAYNSATRGTALVNVCNSTGGVDVGCADLSSDATTGVLKSATVSGITCPGTNCTIKEFYDQTGNLNHATQATVAKRFTLGASCIGSLPCAQGTAASSQCYVSAVNITQSTPFSYVAVINTTSPDAAQTIFSDGKDGTEVGEGTTSVITTLYLWNGATNQKGTADRTATWVAAQYNFISTSVTSLYGNGTLDNTGVNTTSGLFNATNIIIGTFGSAGACGTSQFWNGKFVEGGLWPADLTSNASAMSSNIRTFWGF